MDELTISTIGTVLQRELATMATAIAAFLPNLVAAAAVLLLGWGAARLLQALVRRTLYTLRIDRLASRHRFVEHAGLTHAPSDALGILVFWLVMVGFVLTAIQILGVAAVSATLERLLGYVPNLIGASLVTLLGLLLARFLGSATASAAVAAGAGSPARLGSLVLALAVGLVVIVAIEQLGFATSLLIVPLAVVIATVGVSAGVAFALGAYPIITHILAGHFLKQSLPRDVFVEVEGQQGIVERIGPTDTLFRNGERRWSIPNARLLEHVVQR